MQDILVDNYLLNLLTCMLDFTLTLPVTSECSQRLPVEEGGGVKHGHEGWKN